MELCRFIYKKSKTHLIGMPFCYYLIYDQSYCKVGYWTKGAWNCPAWHEVPLEEGEGYRFLFVSTVSLKKTKGKLSIHENTLLYSHLLSSNALQTNTLLYMNATQFLAYCYDKNNRIHRRKIRLREGNAKCQHLSNWPVGDFLTGIYLSWGPETCTTPPPFTLYACIQYREG